MLNVTVPKSTVLPAAGDEYDAPVVVLPLLPLEDEEMVALRFTFIVVLPFVSVSVPV